MLIIIIADIYIVLIIVLTYINLFNPQITQWGKYYICSFGKWQGTWDTEHSFTCLRHAASTWLSQDSNHSKSVASAATPVNWNISPIAPAQQIATSLSNLSNLKLIQPSVQVNPIIKITQTGRESSALHLAASHDLHTPWLQVTTTNTLGYGELLLPQAGLKLPKVSPLWVNNDGYFISNRNVIDSKITTKRSKILQTIEIN